jgi:hypothetical protein
MAEDRVPCIADPGSEVNCRFDLSCEADRGGPRLRAVDSVLHATLEHEHRASALGHPLGMGGARLVTMLSHEPRRTGGRWGLATMCIGVGQGIAIAVERIDG